MIVSCIGHSMFLLELENGMRIVTDPINRSFGYKVQPLRADAVLMSHKHFDHCAMEFVEGAPQLIDTAGVHTLAPDVTVVAAEADHDPEGGRLRGQTLLFALKAEELTVAHLGDLGVLPSKEQIDALGAVDMLMLPVGGHYTIDAEQARETAELMRARVVLPMHYKTAATADWPIAPIEAFLAFYPEGQVSRQPLLRVTKGDLPCQRHVVVLEPQAL